MKLNAERIFATIVPVLSVVMVLALVGYTQLGYVAPVVKPAQARSPFDVSNLDDVAKGDAAAKAAKAQAPSGSSSDDASASGGSEGSSKRSTSKPSTWADGTFQSSAYGWSKAKPITLATTISDHKITNVSVVSQAETASYFTKARAVIGSVIATQSVDVDVVSGATMSSNGILDSISMSLDKSAKLAKAQKQAPSSGADGRSGSSDGSGAGSQEQLDDARDGGFTIGGDGRPWQPGSSTGGNSSSSGGDPSVPVESIEYADGIYTSTKRCSGPRYDLSALEDPDSEAEKEAAAASAESSFSYRFMGVLQVKNGKIYSFEIYWDRTDADRPFITKAWEGVSAAIANGDEIDTVTGATYSAAVIRDIYDDTMQQAIQKANKARKAKKDAAEKAAASKPAASARTASSEPEDAASAAAKSSSSEQPEGTEDGTARDEAVKPSAKVDDQLAADAPDDEPDDGE